MINIDIQPLTRTVIPKIAAIHKSSLPEDFLPSIGMDFLERIYYPAIIDGNSSIVFVAYNKKVPIGFIVVSRNSSLLISEIISYQRFLFIFLLLKSVLSSIKMLEMTLGIIFTGSLSNKKNNLGEIYTIAVDKEYRGHGVGKLLVDKAEDYLRSIDLPGIMIKTLFTNESWKNFFIKNGWKIASTVKISNKKYVFFTKEFIFDPQKRFV